LVHPDDTQSFAGIGTTNTISDATVNTFALYAVDTIKLGKQWELVGGVRWDYVDSDFSQFAAPTSTTLGFSRTDSLVSWRGALVYKPVEIGSIYFAAGTSFNPS